MSALRLEGIDRLAPAGVGPVTHPLPIDDVEEAFALARDDRDGAMKIAIVFDDVPGPEDS